MTIEKELYDKVQRLRKVANTRNDTIEECARVAEAFPGLNYRPDTITKSDIAAAIRALKDEP